MIAVVAVDEREHSNTFRDNLNLDYLFRNTQLKVNEFNLIGRYFTRTPSQSAVILGVGDDGAIWRPKPELDLAIAADMLVAGRHFFADADPFDIGFKSMAVNLSDMAAMGAEPVAATLCVALPSADQTWLKSFSEGFWKAAETYGVDLIGGDTTRGPLTIAIQMWGELPKGQRLLRSGALPGDDIWVSGELGSAAIGLQHLLGRFGLTETMRTDCLGRLYRPEPRVALGKRLLKIANAAIDVSDGLLSDLGHILTASRVAARLSYDKIPVAIGLESQKESPLLQNAILSGGDDYELCFTVPKRYHAEIKELSRQLRLPLTQIGTIEAGEGIYVEGRNGERMSIGRTGYDHFGGCDS